METNLIEHMPVDNCDFDDVIVESVSLGAEVLVREEAHRLLLVAPTDELEEQTGIGLVDGQIVSFVHD